MKQWASLSVNKQIEKIKRMELFAWASSVECCKERRKKNEKQPYKWKRRPRDQCASIFTLKLKGAAVEMRENEKKKFFFFR